MQHGITKCHVTPLWFPSNLYAYRCKQLHISLLGKQVTKSNRRSTNWAICYEEPLTTGYHLKFLQDKLPVPLEDVSSERDEANWCNATTHHMFFVSTVHETSLWKLLDWSWRYACPVTPTLNTRFRSYMKELMCQVKPQTGLELLCRRTKGYWSKMWGVTVRRHRRRSFRIANDWSTRVGILILATPR